MARAQTTPFNGSKLFIQKNVPGPAETITAVTLTKPGTITIATTTLKRGDAINITGVGDIDGNYIVASVATDVVTLAGADWTDKASSTDPAAGKANKLEFTSTFCELTGITKAGATFEFEDVTTICTPDNTRDEERGLRTEGNLDLSFFYAPDQEIQQLLQDYEFATYPDDKFFSKLELSRNRGTLFILGSIETGQGFEGTTGQRFTSSVSIKPSGRFVWVAKEVV